VRAADRPGEPSRPIAASRACRSKPQHGRIQAWLRSPGLTLVKTISQQTARVSPLDRPQQAAAWGAAAWTDAGLAVLTMVGVWKLKSLQTAHALVQAADSTPGAQRERVHGAGACIQARQQRARRTAGVGLPQRACGVGAVTWGEDQHLAGRERRRAHGGPRAHQPGVQRAAPAACSAPPKRPGKTEKIFADLLQNRWGGAGGEAKGFARR
jgi:hypothetical protein